MTMILRFMGHIIQFPPTNWIQLYNIKSLDWIKLKFDAWPSADTWEGNKLHKNAGWNCKDDYALGKQHFFKHASPKPCKLLFKTQQMKLCKVDYALSFYREISRSHRQIQCRADACAGVSGGYRGFYIEIVP